MNDEDSSFTIEEKNPEDSSYGFEKANKREIDTDSDTEPSLSTEQTQSSNGNIHFEPQESLINGIQPQRFNFRARKKVRNEFEDKTNNRSAEERDFKGLENGDINPGIARRYKKSRKNESCSSSSSLLEPQQNGLNGKVSTTRTDSNIIVYYANDFLAIRNESDNFYLCRTKRNVHKSSKKIKIQWYTNDVNPEIYRADFEQTIDFETILTNVRINRLDKRSVTIPDHEMQRIFNILQRAIQFQNGNDEPPDPHNVLKDGLDISMIGEINDEDVLSKIEQNQSQTVEKHFSLLKNGAKKRTGRQSRNKNKKQKYKNKRSAGNSDVDHLTNQNKCSTPIVKNGGQSSKEPETLVTNSMIEDEKIESMEKNDETILDQFETNDGKDLLFETKTRLPFISDVVNSKLLIRSVLLKDYEFMKSLLTNQKNDLINNVLSIQIDRSVSIKKNAIHYALERQDSKSLGLLLEIENRINHFNLDDPISAESTEIRSIELYHSELMEDQEIYEKQRKKAFPLDDSYAVYCLKNQIPIDFIWNNLKFFKNGIEDFSSNIVKLLKTGDFDSMIDFVEKIKNQPPHRIPTAMHQVWNESFLAKNQDHQTEAESPSLSCIDSKLKLYPIHLAAINPDPSVFQALINENPQLIHLPDCEQWTAIHYAAVCQTFFSLQHLLNLGVSPRATDRKGNTALHLAADKNRIKNVSLIIRHEFTQTSQPSIFNAYNRQGYTPFHVACRRGHETMVESFLQQFQQYRFPIDFVTSNHSGELTGLMMASMHGHFGVCKLLCENGANVNIFDKKNRNALTYAVINGHSNIVEYLLKLNAIPSGKDLFGNNLLHYALAYGWYSCFLPLLKTNINLKDTNTFGLTPIYAALMKEHVGFISYILNKNMLNVNVPVNDAGLNLVMLTFSIPTDPTRMVDYLKLFIEKFKCDLSKTNYEGNNALHHLLEFEAHHSNNPDSTVINAINDSLTILLNNGCDIFTKNHAGISPTVFALANQCFISFSRFLVEHHQNVRFQRILETSDHLWPMIILNASKACTMPTHDDAKTIPLGSFIMDIATKDGSFFKLLKNSALKTSSSGDLPIETFFKISKNLSNHCEPNEMVADFLDFLSKFYESDFLADIFILHLASKFAPSFIIQRLLETFPLLKVDCLDDSNHTPLTLAILNDNIEAARTFLKSQSSSSIIKMNAECLCHYLRKAESLGLVPLLIEHGYDLKQPIDDLGNTSLHMICEKADRTDFTDALKTLIKQPEFDVNVKNLHGQTALHIAFQTNRYSPQLLELYDILQQNGIDLMWVDSNGCNAFSYLFFNDNFDTKNLLEFNLIHDGNDCSRILDRKQRNLLHYSAKMGIVECVQYFLQTIDPNIVDSDDHTPLSLAILNQQRECALVLMRSPKIKIFDSLEFVSKRQTKTNLLWHIHKNGWKDAFYLIQDRVLDLHEPTRLIEKLIQSQCLQYALISIRCLPVTNNGDEQLGKYLRLFGQYTTRQVDKDVQDEFLRFFPKESISNILVELFCSALYNWNTHLCYGLIDMFGIGTISQRIQATNSTDLIVKSFQRLLYEQEFPLDMRNLIETILEHQKQEINTLFAYRIIETQNSMIHYKIIDESNQDHLFLIKYSPLIVAIIRKSYSTVKWLLNLQKPKVDVNFVDSRGRIPLIHAVINNDLKMVQLLLGMEVECSNHDDDCKIEPDSQRAKTIHLFKRDRKNFTVFHYLISPFSDGYFYRADQVFSMLWNLIEIDSDYQKTEFLKELEQHATEQRAYTILTVMEKLTSSLSSTTSSGLRGNHLPHDDEPSISMSPNQIGKNFRSCSQLSPIAVAAAADDTAETSSVDPNSSQYSKKNIMVDDLTNIPYNVTFTKLDYDENRYVYNFYKMQFYSVGKHHYCLSIRWGRVGTFGNVQRIFYDSYQDGLDHFQKIFASKSGENWANFNSSYSIQDKCGAVVNPDHITDIAHQHNLPVEILLEKLTTMGCDEEFSGFKPLFLKFIPNFRLTKNQFKHCNIENLNTTTLECCSAILDRLSSLITYPSWKKIQNKKENLELLYDMIDSSDHFYSTIKIFGHEKDQLKPILGKQDILQKSEMLRELKFFIFSSEFLHSITTHHTFPDNVWNYMKTLLKWNLKTVSTELQPQQRSMDLISTYLSEAIPGGTVDLKGFNLYEMCFSNDSGDKKPAVDNDGGQSYLLWYHLKTPELLHFLINGFEKQVFLLHTDSPTFVNGIGLRSKFTTNHFDENDYLVLCEALIEKPCKDSDLNDHQIEEISSNSSTSRTKQQIDCVLINRNVLSENQQDYLFWKGSIVPINKSPQDESNQFIHLAWDKITPRFMVEFNAGQYMIHESC